MAGDERHPSPPPPTPAPNVVIREPDDDLLRTLQQAQLLLLKYPIAAQAAFKALATEGRRFGETPAGRRWKARLAGSELIRRARVLWESSALNMFEESNTSPLPSSVIDAVLSAVASSDFTTLLSRLVPRDHDDADLDPARRR